MSLSISLWTRGRKAHSGQTFTEYALLMLAVALTAYTAYLGLGGGIKQVSNGLIVFINAATAAL
jgi:Flp pilus assembly pilin Flp